MVTDTYESIRELLTNGNLVPGEEYCINDYDEKLKPVVTAVDESTMDTDGYALLEGSRFGDCSYDLLNDGRYDWESDKGWMYYLQDETNNISAYFDWYTLSGGFDDSHDIGFLENTDETGMFMAPPTSLEIDTCSNVRIGRYSGGSIFLKDAEHIIIGDMNENLSITNASYVKIGNQNDGITVLDSDGITIGDGNYNCSISTSEFIDFGSDNEDVTITGEGNVVGSASRNSTVNGNQNIFKNKNISSKLIANWGTLDKNSVLEVNGAFSKLERCSNVTIDTTAIGNVLSDAARISLKDVKNNTLNTADINLESKASFSSWENVNGIRTYNESKKAKVANKADGNGIVLNLKYNEIDTTIPGGQDYYMADNVFMAKPSGKGGGNYYEVTVSAPANISVYYDFTGEGTYRQGDTWEVTAVAKEIRGKSAPTIAGYLILETGVTLNGSTVTGQMGGGNVTLQPLTSLI